MTGRLMAVIPTEELKERIRVTEAQVKDAIDKANSYRAELRERNRKRVA